MDELEEVIMFIIDQTSKSAKRYSQREFDEKGLGITIDQWVLLKIIERYDGLSQKELAEHALRDNASITRTLNLLEKKGFIHRSPLEDNRRQYSIILTQEGIAFIKEHMPMVKRHREKSISGFTKEELHMLKSMLMKIKKNFE